MKTKHFLFATLLAVILTGCYDDDKLWDAVNQQTARIEALESWQKETNSNIQALQTLVSTQDYITQVTPVTLGGDTVGYTIAFKNSKSISIYHGQKGDTGEKGEAGIAGTVPTISATQEADGNWYWTLNGALMKDASGNPVRANGQTGPAAPTPLLKTGKELTSQGTSGHWIADAAYLSVDNGNSWKKVSGDDGQDGSNGTSGDSMFSKVTTFENEGYVAFRLSNGKEFQVPIYKALTLSFTYKDETLDPNNFIGLLDGNTTITYNIEGSLAKKEKVKVSAIITSDNGWKATLDSKAKTIKFTLPDPAKTATVSITATDNAGQSCSYILNLKKFFDGTGKQNDPYTIHTTDELKYFAQQVNEGNTYEGEFIKLSNDLDLTGIEWTPIGNYDTNMTFNGTFDGDNHTISYLNVNKDRDYVGFFGLAENATFQNIILFSPIVITQNGGCGALVSYSGRSTFINCYVINGKCSTPYGNAGGLIGSGYESTITNCHVKNTIVTGFHSIGGLIGGISSGEANNTYITNCSATECTLTSSDGGYCGGLIGVFDTNTLNLKACYATGRISSKNYVEGALLGAESESNGKSGTVIMTGCYSTVTDQNGVASLTLQGAKTENGTSTFKACYYITDQRTGTVDGITYQTDINDTMIAAMNAACNEDYYDQYGALIPKP